MIYHYGWVRCFLSGNCLNPALANKRVFDLSGWSCLISKSARLGTSRLVTLDIPSALSERVTNALKAEPRTVDLRSLAPNYYRLSERVLELFEEEEMVDILSTVRGTCSPLRGYFGEGALANFRCRLSKSALLRLLTMHITRKVPLEMVWSSYKAWMRQNDGVCPVFDVLIYH